MNITAAKTYIDVDQAGYDQIPAVSNYQTPDNIPSTIKWCRDHCSKERIKGYFLTPWVPTLEAKRDRHFDAINHFAAAIRDFSLA